MRFRCLYDEQSNVKLSNPFGNTADLYNRETITVLGKIIDEMCEHESFKTLFYLKISSCLKISLLNLLNLTGQMLIGHFVVQQDDRKSAQIVYFLKVLKLFENEIFGDAYYENKNMIVSLFYVSFVSFLEKGR